MRNSASLSRTVSAETCVADLISQCPWSQYSWSHCPGGGDEAEASSIQTVFLGQYVEQLKLLEELQHVLFTLRGDGESGCAQ